MRIFTALYTGEETDSVRDARNNWRTKLNKVSVVVAVKIVTPEIIAVIILKFQQDGFTIQQYMSRDTTKPTK